MELPFLTNGLLFIYFFYLDYLSLMVIMGNSIVFKGMITIVLNKRSFYKHSDGWASVRNSKHSRANRVLILGLFSQGKKQLPRHGKSYIG